jgi:hypothetical protein
VIHGTLLEAFQGQPAPVDMEAAAVPPLATTSCEGGATVYVQPLAWAMVTIRPPRDIVPCRAGPEFAATENCTWPLPLPDDEPPSVIQGAPLAADQVHPWVLVTWMTSVLAAAPTFTLVGLTSTAHPDAWLTVTI